MAQLSSLRPFYYNSLHASPLFPRSSGETHSPFRLILERCLRQILADNILDDICLGKLNDLNANDTWRGDLNSS